VRALGIIEPSPGADPVGSVLSRLIDRELMLAEVDRYAPPEPDAADIDREVAGVRARFPSQKVFDDTLARSGYDVTHVREIERQNLRLRAYLDQRFNAPENDPGNRMVNVVNQTGRAQNDLTVSARTYDMTGKRLDQKEAWNINLPSQGVMNGLFNVPVPTLAPVGGVPQRTYFLELLLKRGTKIIDRNVYWLSTVGDVPTYTGNAYPNLSTYGDLRNLQTPAQDPINGLLPLTTVDACACRRRLRPPS